MATCNQSRKYYIGSSRSLLLLAASKSTSLVRTFAIVQVDSQSFYRECRQFKWELNLFARHSWSSAEGHFVDLQSASLIACRGIFVLLYFHSFAACWPTQSLQSFIYLLAGPAASGYVLCFAELESKLLFTVQKIIVLVMQKRIETTIEPCRNYYYLQQEMWKQGGGEQSGIVLRMGASLRGTFLFLPHSRYSNNQMRRIDRSNLELVWPRLNHNYYPPHSATYYLPECNPRTCFMLLTSLFVLLRRCLFVVSQYSLLLTQSTGIRVPCPLHSPYFISTWSDWPYIATYAVVWARQKRVYLATDNNKMELYLIAKGE